MTEKSNSQFVRLLTRHHSTIYAYIYSLHPNQADADDIMQETSASLWKRFDAYDPSQGPFLPWAYRFAFYEVLKLRKTKNRSRIIFNDSLLEKISETFEAHQETIDARSNLLQNCLQKLPENDKDLISCRYGNRTNVITLSKQINTPVKRLYRELERIRLVLFQCVDRQVNHQRGIV